MTTCPLNAKEDVELKVTGNFGGRKGWFRSKHSKPRKKIGFKIKNQLNYWFNPINTDRLEVTQLESQDKIIVVNDMFDLPFQEKSQM